MINDSINRFLGVLCYPFLAMEEFHQDLIQEYMDALRKPDVKEIKEVQKHLKNRVILYIRQNYNIYSYDEIYLYLEKCYLYNAEKYNDALQIYWHIMEEMATSLITHRNGRIAFKYWKNKKDEVLFGGFAGNNKVTLFHSLNCHIPMDVIAIVYMLINQKKRDIGCLDYFYGNIEVADQQLSHILEEGVAENHLHKGVSRTFSSIWDSMMEPLTTDRGRYFQNNGKGFIKGSREQSKQLLFYILCCGIVRAYLALEIQARRQSREISWDIEIKELVRYFRDGGELNRYFRNNFLEQDEKEVVSFYVRLWDRLEKELPEDSFKGKLCTRVLETDMGIHTLDENVFLYHALFEIICENTSFDIKQCMMQYLRVRNYLFHVSVQQKTIKGLDYFQEGHYELNSTLNHLNIKDFWETALREQLQNRDIQKIEFRASMPDKSSHFNKEVIKFLKAYQKIIREDYCYYDGKSYIPYRRIPRVGLVIHFLKRQDDTTPDKCIQNSGSDCSYLYFGKLQQTYEKQIEVFTQLRNEYAELSRYLVGIDAASLENATPVWVFAPIYEKARDSKSEPIGRKSGCSDYVQSLGFTFHAGEDFRHILSGLRRIDEAVEFLKFHAGDRIGHGIALGIPPRKWKGQNPVIIIPQIEALENYLWAYDILSKNYSNFQASILAYMERQIYELSDKIYGDKEGDGERKDEGISIEILISGYQRQFETDSNSTKEDLEMIEKSFCRKLWEGEQIVWNSKLLTAARHCKRYVKEMERPIHYEITEQDLMIVEEVQKILKKKLGKKGIVIEVNPSSNTAIADFDVIQENQLYQLNNMDEEQNVIVCINSDDPSVFNTNVSNELSYIYYGMLEQNINREAALLWIDRIRKNGLNSSFIRCQESDEQMLRKLDDLLRRI